MKNIILHIGLHKTATTTLQEQFFPECEGLELLTTLQPGMKQFVINVTRNDPAYFSAENSYKLIEPYLSDSKLNLLSNESFSGPPFAGAIEGELDHRTPVLNNLKSVFPDAKVIVVIRRQDALAKSFYRQYIKSGGTRRFNRFFALNYSKRPSLMSLNRFYYKPYIDYLYSLFDSNVLVLPFEYFVNDQKGFFSKLSTFVDVKLPDMKLKKFNATSFGSTGLEICRLVNHLFRNHLNPGGILPGIPMKKYGNFEFITPVEFISDNWPIKGSLSKNSQITTGSEKILNLVKEDNRQLDEQYKLNLKQYGYYE